VMVGVDQRADRPVCHLRNTREVGTRAAPGGRRVDGHHPFATDQEPALLRNQLPSGWTYAKIPSEISCRRGGAELCPSICDVLIHRTPDA
jgi:hypothetical protein